MSDPAKSPTIPVPDGHSHAQTQETEPRAEEAPELAGTGVNPLYVRLNCLLALELAELRGPEA